MFVRLKLTTMEGKEFLSPFVYVIEEGERKLEKLKWLRVRKMEGKRGARTIKSGKLELVEVERREFPVIALYGKQLNDLSTNAYIERIRMVEKEWRKEVAKHEEKEERESRTHEVCETYETDPENRGSAMGFNEDSGEGPIEGSCEETPRFSR